VARIPSRSTLEPGPLAFRRAADRDTARRRPAPRSPCSRSAARQAGPSVPDREPKAADPVCGPGDTCAPPDPVGRSRQQLVRCLYRISGSGKPTQSPRRSVGDVDGPHAECRHHLALAIQESLHRTEVRCHDLGRAAAARVGDTCSGRRGCRRQWCGRWYGRKFRARHHFGCRRGAGRQPTQRSGAAWADRASTASRGYGGLSVPSPSSSTRRGRRRS